MEKKCLESFPPFPSSILNSNEVSNQHFRKEINVNISDDDNVPRGQALPLTGSGGGAVGEAGSVAWTPAYTATCAT